MQAANGVEWVYTATVENVAVEGSIIKATATDTPGNVVALEETISL